MKCEMWSAKCFVYLEIDYLQSLQHWPVYSDVIPTTILGVLTHFYFDLELSIITKLCFAHGWLSLLLLLKLSFEVGWEAIINSAFTIVLILKICKNYPQFSIFKVIDWLGVVLLCGFTIAVPRIIVDFCKWEEALSWCSISFLVGSK